MSASRARSSSILTRAGRFSAELSAWLASHPGETRTRTHAEESELADLFVRLLLFASVRDGVARELEHALDQARRALGPGGSARMRERRALEAIGLLGEHGRRLASRDGHDDGALLWHYLVALRWGADEETAFRRWHARGGDGDPPLRGSPVGIPPREALALALDRLPSNGARLGWSAARTRLRRLRARLKGDPNARARLLVRDSDAAFPIPKDDPPSARLGRGVSSISF